jgi:hypothetical protein
MANPRPTVTDEFVEQYTNPQTRFAPEAANDNRSIRNVQVVRAAAEVEERKQITRYEPTTNRRNGSKYPV